MYPFRPTNHTTTISVCVSAFILNTTATNSNNAGSITTITNSKAFTTDTLVQVLLILVVLKLHLCSIFLEKNTIMENDLVICLEIIFIRFLTCSNYYGIW